jgi:hypothetical protein
LGPPVGLSQLLFAYPGRLHRRERLADCSGRSLTPSARAALNSAIWRPQAVSERSCAARADNLLTTAPRRSERAPWSIDATALQEAAMALRQPETLLDRASFSIIARAPLAAIPEGDDGD